MSWSMMSHAYTDENIKRYPMMKGRGPWSRKKITPKLAQFAWLFVIIGGLVGFETDLTRAYQEGNRLYWMGLFFLIVLSNMFYLIASVSNPGYTEPTEWDEEDNELQRLLDNRNRSRRPSDTPPLEYCEQCSLTQPLRSRHCFDCGRCCSKWDHHCPFVGNCVGGHNHRFFVLYLAIESYLVYWGLMIVLSSFRDLDFHFDGETLATWGARAPWVVSLSLMLCSSAMLFCFHSYLMLFNRTTREIIMTQRYGSPYPEHLVSHLRKTSVHPFSEGFIWNVWSGVTGRLKSEFSRCYHVEDPSLVTLGHQFVQRSVRTPYWLPQQPAPAAPPVQTQLNTVAVVNGVEDETPVGQITVNGHSGKTHIPARTEFKVVQPEEVKPEEPDVDCVPVDRRRRQIS